MFLKRCPCLFLLQLGSPGSEDFLELPRFRDKVLGDEDDLPFFDRLARRGCVIDTLVQPRVEAFEGLVGIVGFLDLPVFLVQVCCRYPRLVHV